MCFGSPSAPVASAPPVVPQYSTTDQVQQQAQAQQTANTNRARGAMLQGPMSTLGPGGFLGVPTKGNSNLGSA